MKVGRGILVGVGTGWLVGMLWWSGLMVTFGPSVAVTHDSTGWHERQITVWDRLRYAPLTAVPWAVVGGIVGAAAGRLGGYAVPLASLAGTVAGGVYVLATTPVDGWLALTMPGYCLAGTLI